MREILFRGFHECENGGTVITVNGIEKRGEWVEATSLICNFGSLENKVNNVWEHSRLIERGSQIGVASGTDGKQNLICTTFEVIPETVSQFTGLMDRNGKRIFENDILNIDTYSYEEPEDSMCGQVDIGMFGNAITWKENEAIIYNYLNDIQGSYTTIYEVVGNIFENADLMEEEKQC